MNIKKYLEPRELSRNARRSALVALFILIVWLVTTFLGSALFVTSIGASAFIVFTFPRAESTRARYLFGGYITACVFGVICSFAMSGFSLEHWGVVAFSVTAVLASSLVMSIFDLEHPPSIALAISVVLSDTPVQMALTAVLCMTALYFSKRLVLIGEDWWTRRFNKSTSRFNKSPENATEHEEIAK